MWLYVYILIWIYVETIFFSFFKFYLKTCKNYSSILIFIVYADKDYVKIENIYGHIWYIIIIYLIIYGLFSLRVYH